MTVAEFLKNHSNLELVSDSRKANSKTIFVAMKGSKVNSHQFLNSVYEQGCRHFILEEINELKSFEDIHYIQVLDSKKAWSQAWKFKSKNPDHDLKVVGVTGTNGKTSITLMIESILNFNQTPCGVLGTIDHHLVLDQKVKTWPTSLTTPGSEILFPRLKEMKMEGAKAVALEISSHALDQNRAEGLDLDVAVFSNLTEDHLDYHNNLTHYFESKVKLFEDLLKNSIKKHKTSILNYSDPWIQKYFPPFGQVEVIVEVNSFENLSSNLEVQKTLAFVKAKSNISRLNLLKVNSHDLNGLKFSLWKDYSSDNLKTNILNFELPVMGIFQATNWAQAALACLSLGVSEAKVIESALHFSGVPGRLQKVLNTKGKNVFVDYAHTPDALKRTLMSLRQICSGRLGVVFGCGGDRDTFKRPQMGEIAQSFSDFQIITNDNPRSEDPMTIASQIASGFKTNKPTIELERRSAIKLGLSGLKSENDVLLIAGKGHENYQILQDHTIDFSDVSVTQELLK